MTGNSRGVRPLTILESFAINSDRQVFRVRTGTTGVGWVETPRFFLAGRIIALNVGDKQTVPGPRQAVMGSPFAGA